MKTWLVAGVLRGFALAASPDDAQERPQVYDVEAGSWRMDSEEYLWESVIHLEQ